MEEISLKEIVEIILKGKWIIAVITAVCVLLTGFASFFVLSPQYEAETMLMISPINVGEISAADANGIKGIVSALSQYPIMTIDTYKEQVKAPAVLEYVKKEASLDCSVNKIAGKLDVKAIDNTNIIRITAKDKDPEMAARLANITSEKFTSFVSETSRKQAEKSAEFIKSEQELEKQRLDEAQEALKNFLAQPRGPEELRQELDSRLDQITGFKTQITQVEMDRAAVSEKLKKVKALLDETPKYFEVYKTLSDDDVLMGIVKDSSGKKISDIAGLTMTEYEINEEYTSLVSKANNYEINLTEINARKENLEKKISEGQKTVESLQADLAEKQQVYDQLSHQIYLIKQTYDAYQQKYKEAMIKQSAEIGKQSIIVVSSAVAPENPVAPNKGMNIAIALVLGLMIGVFVVLFKEYWLRDEKPAAFDA